MKITKELHVEIFEWLYKWSQDAIVQYHDNPYFATRFRRDEKFQNGFYFQGNDDYLAITFWTGSDYMHKTPNIYFEINIKDGARAWMVGRDSEQKNDFFGKLSKKLTGWKPGKMKGTYFREFSNSTEDYLFYLSEFIKQDKTQIDIEIHKSIGDLEDPDEFLLEDEYSSKFGFISAGQFDKMISRVIEHRKKEEIKKEGSRIQGDAMNSTIDKPLPLTIESISIINFHEIKFAEIKSMPRDAKWIFLTGENGQGKTSVLQSIVLGLTDWNENKLYVEDEKTTIRAGYFMNSLYKLNTNNSKGSDAFVSLNELVVAYGPARLNPLEMELQNKDRRKNSNVDGLFRTNANLKNVDYELSAAWSENDKTYFNLLVSAIKMATNGQISNIIVNPGLTVYYTELLDDSQYSREIRYDQISAGFKNIINIVGDIITRLFEKEFHTKLSDIIGIVIIDELENHLHPKIQFKIASLLSEVFPNIQFVSSTHSPIPLMGAPNKSVFIKVSRTAGNGVQLIRLEKLEKEISTLLPNTILTSDIFDFDLFEGTSEEDFNEKKLENNYDDIEKNKMLDERLKNLDRNIFPDDLFLNKD